MWGARPSLFWRVSIAISSYEDVYRDRANKTRGGGGVGGGEKEIRWLVAGSPHWSQPCINIQIAMPASSGRGLTVSEAVAGSRPCAMHLSPEPKTAAERKVAGG